MKCFDHILHLFDLHILGLDSFLSLWEVGQRPLATQLAGGLTHPDNLVRLHI